MKVLLQTVRKMKGLSQNELALLTRMSPQNIQKIEQGDAKSMTFNALGRFCKVLQCQPGDLLIYEDEPDSDELLDSQTEHIETPLQSKKKKKGKANSQNHLHSNPIFNNILEMPESA